MKSKQDGSDYLKSIVSDHLPSTARQYKFRVHNGELGQNFMGFNVDPQPFEGKVIDIGSDWIVFKSGKSNFLVCDSDLIPVLPNIGDTVKVVPHQRKRFDGTSVSEPIVEDKDGYQTQTFTIGSQISHFPVDKDSLKSEYLRDMLNQIELSRSPDGIRTTAQVLIDAGARGDSITYVDPVMDDVFKTPPTVTFQIETMKHKGTLSVIYDRGLDYYSIELRNQDDSIRERIDQVDFMQLPEFVHDLVDDGTWKNVNVDVLKPAPKKRVKI